MGHGFSRIERIHADYFGSIGCESVESVLLSRKSFASWKRFLPRTMATSVHVHVHDHVNVHELPPRLTLGVDVDVVVDVHVDVVGFFHLDAASPHQINPCPILVGNSLLTSDGAIHMMLHCLDL